MKFAIAILALFGAAVALPLCALRIMRKSWERGSATKSGCNLRGAAFAKILLLHGRAPVGLEVVEGSKLFREHFDPASNSVVLSREVYEGRTLAALAVAALQAGIALAHVEDGKAFRRLGVWRSSLRILVNVLPVFLLLMLFHPGSWRTIPLLGVGLLLLAAIQLLTYPAVHATTAKIREIILRNQLLPPSELPEFTQLLNSMAQRHFAAPILDCFWFRCFLRLGPRRQQ